MIVTTNDSSNSIGYYDLEHNRVTVRGFSYSDNAEKTKILRYPGILPNMYSISTSGKIYSFINESIISWSLRGNLPYVNLPRSQSNGRITLEPFFIKDLMAYNFISDAWSYLERGCRAVNIDGDTMNCYFTNIIYLEP